MKGILLDLDSGPAASKPPPGFAECYVCKRQFGSHSLALHEPRCLQKWRAANDALPPDKQSSAPIKLNGNSPKLPHVASLTASWPSSNGRLLAAMASPSQRTSRPGTTTLTKPKVLDAQQAHNLDMTTTRVRELLAVTSLSDRSGDESRGSNYSLSFDSPSSSPINSSTSSSSSEDVVREHECTTVRRPGTMKLGSGPRELNVPHIEQRVRTAVISTPEQRAAFMAAEPEPRMPSPCVSCGKRDNPERLHSHPEDQPAGRTSPTAAAPARARRTTKRRLSVQRPLPLHYHRQTSRERRPAAGAGRPYQDTTEQRRLDPAERKRLERRKEARERQAHLKEEEERRQKREQAMQLNLQLALQYERPLHGPAFIVCYVCGRQFGPTSLPIHQPQCLERWHKSNPSKRRRQRRPPSPHPPEQLPVGTSLERYNQLATDGLAQRMKDDEAKQEKKPSIRPRPVRTPEPVKSSSSDKSLFFIEF